MSLSKADFSKLAGRAGFCIGDYANRGFDDVFATHWGQNVLYRNHGDGIFMDVLPPRLWRPGFSIGSKSHPLTRLAPKPPGDSVLQCETADSPKEMRDLFAQGL
jgi:hypothetical protein